ncbi:hypothetical protein PHMEG_00030453 [Phytophthora megakarya]|uniref:Uncharacterized protein n=1 Tax=Phytophthora megakarya TaxID=4795 RepID=A0A225V1W7_9STRA|nr:hypothetical protein PHMEG_00030453 [Phytophthora megakarya]
MFIFATSYDGETRNNERVGNVMLRVNNNKSPHTELTLPFKNVQVSSDAPDNLMSLDQRET